MQGGFLERGQLGGGLFDGVARGRAAGCGEVAAGSDVAQPGAEALQVAELGLSTDASIPKMALSGIRVTFAPPTRRRCNPLIVPNTLRSACVRRYRPATELSTPHAVWRTECPQA